MKAKEADYRQSNIPLHAKNRVAMDYVPDYLEGSSKLLWQRYKSELDLEKKYQAGNLNKCFSLDTVMIKSI